MILDGLSFLSGSMLATGGFAGQAVNGAGSILSTNTMDLAPLTIGGNQLADAGRGEHLELAITVITAPTVGTAVQFQLIQADDAALSVNVEVINQTDAIPIASLPAGTLVPLNLNRGGPYAPRRYLGMRYVNTGAIATASYIAGFTKDVQTTKTMIFKAGFAIS